MQHRSIFLLITLSSTIIAMEGPVKKESCNAKHILTITPKKEKIMSGELFDINGTVAKMIERLPSGAIFHAALFTPTDMSVVNASIEAHKKGVVGQFVLDQQALEHENGMSFAQKLHDAGIKVHVFNADKRYKRDIREYPTSDNPVQCHYKFFITKSIDNDATKVKVLHGTHNISYNAERNNKELCSLIPQDNELYESFFKMFKKVQAVSVSFDESLKLRAGEKIDALLPEPAYLFKAHQAIVSPKKRTAFSSDTHNIDEYLERSIKRTKKGDSIFIASMSIDHPNTVKKLSDAAGRGVDTSVLVDAKEAKTSYKFDQLKNLKKSGVTVKLYDTSNSIGVMHIKLAQINTMINGKPNHKILTGSANFLNKNSQKDFNATVIEPAPDKTTLAAFTAVKESLIKKSKDLSFS